MRPLTQIGLGFLTWARRIAKWEDDHGAELLCSVATPSKGFSLRPKPTSTTGVVREP